MAIEKSTDEAQLEVMVHISECLYYFFTDGGDAEMSEDESAEVMNDCQTMALLMARSMGLNVTSVNDEEITVNLSLQEPVEFLDSALKS
jgi:hypothetical protein